MCADILIYVRVQHVRCNIIEINICNKQYRKHNNTMFISGTMVLCTTKQRNAFRSVINNELNRLIFILI